MWSTWFSVLTRYRMGPCASASARIATALVGSCGVSMTTTPSDVATKLGLQPRSLLVVKTFEVTRSNSRAAVGMSGLLAWSGWVLLRGGQAAVDAEHLPGHERRGIGDEEDRGADQVVRGTHPAERDAVDDAGLEVGVAEERCDLRRVDEGRHDRVDTDPVL